MHGELVRWYDAHQQRGTHDSAIFSRDQFRAMRSDQFDFCIAAARLALLHLTGFPVRRGKPQEKRPCFSVPASRVVPHGHSGNTMRETKIPWQPLDVNCHAMPCRALREVRRPPRLPGIPPRNLRLPINCAVSSNEAKPFLVMLPVTP